MHLSDHGSGEATSTDNVTESNANILTEDIKNIQLDEVIAREPPSAASKPPADAPPASLQGAELAAEIVRQVEFYFSDANLPTDDYMLKQIRCTPEGWGELLHTHKPVAMHLHGSRELN